MIFRRWAILEERQGQRDRIVSRHFFRTAAESRAVLAYEAWRHIRDEIKAGRFVWDWTRNRPVRLKSPVQRIHPEMAGRGSLWPDTEYYVVALPFELKAAAPA